jgi:hypothetical protein
MKILQIFSEEKISIEEAEETAKIDIPLSLVRFGMRFIPLYARKQMLEKGVNPEDIFREIESGTVGKLVEVEQGSDQVEV